jgi:hypothetical protein
MRRGALPTLLAGKTTPVDANAQNLGIHGLKFGQIKLEGQGIRRSGMAKGGDVEEDDEVFPAEIIREADVVSRRGWQGEIGNLVADL